MTVLIEKRYYAGIGSRKTPEPYLQKGFKIGSFLAKRGYILRSGRASGMDQEMERGCDAIDSDLKEIWHPDNLFFPLHEWATDLASEFCWEFPLEKMRGGSIKLITRNMYQIFGCFPQPPSPEDRVRFVVYYCEGDPLKKGFDSGGTRYAVRAAHKAGIPHFNLRTQGNDFASFFKALD